MSLVSQLEFHKLVGLTFHLQKMVTIRVLMVKPFGVEAVVPTEEMMALTKYGLIIIGVMTVLRVITKELISIC